MDFEKVTLSLDDIFAKAKTNAKWLGIGAGIGFVLGLLF